MKPVKLKELADEMQSQMNEWTTFLNKKTGEFVPVSDDELRIAEDGEDVGNAFSLVEIDEDRVKMAEDILDNSDDYIELPSRFDIDEYDIMERFCESIKNGRDRDALLIAIKGSGAFRRFKEIVRRFGLEDDWYRFKDEAYQELAIEWCNENGILFEE